MQPIMSLQSSRPKYGSLLAANLTKSSRIFPDSEDTSADRSSFDFDPSLALRRERDQNEGGGGKGWFSLVVVGVLAVGVMMVLTHAGYRLPKITRKIDPSDRSSPSLIDASDAVASKKPETALAVHLPRRPTAEIASSTVQLVRPLPNTLPPTSPPQEEELSQLSFTALNFYHVRDGKPAQDYPWLKEVKLIEPHRDTTLAVSSPRDGFEYRWKISGGEKEASGELRAEASGVEVVVVLSRLDDHVVVLEEVDANGGATRRLEEKVMVKYVRREIRTLTDEERGELLDAMYTLWSVRVDGGNGKELYGEDYADIYAINRLHYKAASADECDHFHDGLGFMTNHAVISNTFEYSLQKVNPKLTLPYWDFTIEGSSAGGIFGESVSSAQELSEIFTPEWFGTYDPDDNMVKDGRWAYTEIPQMRTNNPGGVEPDVYSQLRAPWNINNRSYLTRGMGNICGVNVDEGYPWPTCEMHYSMATSYSDFYSWAWYSLYDPHGPVHIWIGGVLDCEDKYTLIASLVGPDIAKDLALHSFVHRKDLYRDGVFSCTGTASTKQAPVDLLRSGQCGCQGYDLTQGDDYEAIYNRLVDLDELIGDFDSDVKRQVVAALCTTPSNDGDHLQASSSMDPSFYVTHPTMERLWMYSVLTGKIKDYSWPDSDVTITKPDGSTVSESTSVHGDTCIGHRGSDVFPFGLLDTDTDGFEVKTGVQGMESGNTLTNRELLQAFDARSNSLSYVYDTFKWTHCKDDDFDFDDAWTTSNSNADTSKIRWPQFKQGVKRVPMYDFFERRRAAHMAKKNAQQV